jgi:hypothetical protein
MNIRVTGSLLMLLLPLLVFGQRKIKSVAVTDEIIFATVDRPGDLYIMTKAGVIQKFDKDGKLLGLYKNDPAPTLFDPRDGARLFAYFHNDQHYSFLNPAFDVTRSHKIDPSTAIDPLLMCVSGDLNFWILDGADISLKRVNGTTGVVDVDIKIDDSASGPAAFTYMREYQGFLFLLHKEKGILVFNSLGKWLKTIELPALSNFNFLGEELYYPEKDQIKFFNLFTAEKRSVPMKQPGRFVLLTDERQFFIQPTSIEFFETNP